MKNLLITSFLILLGLNSWGQDATIQGVVKDINGNPIFDVSVNYKEKGVTTNEDGFYQIKVPGGTEVSLVFKHLGFHTTTKKLRLKKNVVKILQVVLIDDVQSIKEVEIISHRDAAEGIQAVKVETVKNMTSANSSIESTLTVTELGTSKTNALSTQYKVRGGNYDENLVYINGIQVYRPFLVRSGQQEGLSFLNVDMTNNVSFSSGGFQAKYGDKLSSVLDINYRKPKEFGLKSEVSLLGASITTEGVTPDNKSTGILGFRYRDNSLFVNSKDIKSNFNPRFVDVQSFFTHQFHKKFSLEFLGTFSMNDYNYKPTFRISKFGTLLDPKELKVYYSGNEIDRYVTAFGALNAKYRINEKWKLNLTTSVFNTQEEEFFDIAASYELGDPDTDAASDNYGESDYTEGIGSQLDHARNALDALIANVQIKANYHSGKNRFIYGAKYQIEDIRDHLVEWQLIDSSGFSIRPPGHVANNQPYEPFEGPIVPFQDLRGSNHTNLQRVMGFAQWNRKAYIGDHQLWMNVGVRAQQWSIDQKNQLIWSPRFQIAIKPDLEERDLLFRLSGGSYSQAPFYKEMRNSLGEMNTDVKAQKSWHLVLGGDYSFEMWNRPFKLVSEAYYKYITDVNPYTLDNVRIRYAAKNNAVAFARGFDLRLNGEFVSGTESWFNFSYLDTKESIDNQGYIARPSDQRLKFSILFQDYVPSIPNLKMYMNLVYNTGVPGGSPTYANPYDYQTRLGDYRRADLGVFYILKDAQKSSTKKWLAPFKEFSVGAEVFNMFNMSNAITNTWIRNVYTNQMSAVKNTMSRRVYNIKLKIEL